MRRSQFGWRIATLSIISAIGSMVVLSCGQIIGLGDITQSTTCVVSGGVDCGIPVPKKDSGHDAGHDVERVCNGGCCTDFDCRDSMAGPYCLLTTNKCVQCIPEQPDEPVDSGVDAGVNSGHDAGIDSGHDAAHDASRDAGDAAKDATKSDATPHDAATDATISDATLMMHDAGHDSGSSSSSSSSSSSVHDAGHDAPPTCPIGQYCALPATGVPACLAGCERNSDCSPDSGLTTCCPKENNACVDTQNDPENCGGCNNVCSTFHLSNPTCVKGRCAGTCDQNWANCTGLNDGCETQIIGSDTNNCGACGVVCSGNNATPQCTAGKCTSKCASGFANCAEGDAGGALQANGCTTNTYNSSLTDDPPGNPEALNNCGGCGIVCSTVNVPTPHCGAGKCNGACSPGYVDCMGNEQAHGCETFIEGSGDPTSAACANCGGCGASCKISGIQFQCCAGQTIPLSQTCDAG